jgi:hypothetical protein
MEILDIGFWIADVWYRFALSFFINMIRWLPAPKAYSTERGGS